VFESAGDHLLYEIILGSDRLLYCSLAAHKVAISQGHLLVIRKQLPKAFRELQGRIGEFAELSRVTTRKLIARNHPWRRGSAAVHTIRTFPDKHHVILKSDEATAGVNAKYWRLALLVAPQPVLYVTSERSPVYVEHEGTLAMILMPLRLTGADRVGMRRKTISHAKNSRPNSS
jgi:hypothetical protein